MPKFSIIIPAYNEEEVVETAYARLKKVMDGVTGEYELIFINDGSGDKTLEMLKDIAAKDSNVRVLSFSRNFGHQIAVTSGLDAADGDAVVVIDCDLQDPPEVIPYMIELWEDGYEVVYGKRKKRKGDSFFKRATAYIFYRVLAMLSTQKIPTDVGDFRLMDRKVVLALRQMGETNRFIRGMVAWAGFKQIPYEFDRDERLAGVTKYPLKKMIKFASDGLVSFSVKPLMIAVYCGMITIFLTVVYAVVALVLHLSGTFVAGWQIGLMIVLVMLGWMQILLGIIGAYVGRIYEQTKGRPLYFISEKIGFEEIDG